MRRTPLAALLLAVASAAAAPSASGQAAAPDSAPVPLAKIPLAREGAAPVAEAMAARTLAPGETVRVVAAAGRYAGTVARIGPDTIVVGTPRRLDAIPRGEVMRIERMAGRSSRGRAIALGAGGGLVTGGVLGAIAGRLAGRVRCRADDGPCTPGEHDATIQGALLAEGAVVGSLLGAMIGPMFRRTRWEDAHGAFPATVAPAEGGGVAAGVSLRF